MSDTHSSLAMPSAGICSPAFVVVGGMKCGTSTLRHYLSQVPDIGIPEGEVHFFSNAAKFARGRQWYERQFTQYAGKSCVGEKSATYHVYPGVAERMAATYPQMKLIWLLREPAGRSYSHYWHIVSNGLEPRSLSQAIAEEIAEPERDHPFRRYLYRSRYAEHIRQFLQHFPANQMHYLLLDDLLRDPEQACRQLCAFLGVEFRHDYAVRWTGAKNVRSHAPRWLTLQRWLRSEGTRDSLPSRALRRLNVRMGPPIPPVNAADRAKLRQQLAPSVAELAELTGLPVIERWGYGRGAA